MYTSVEVWSLISGKQHWQDFKKEKGMASPWSFCSSVSVTSIGLLSVVTASCEVLARILLVYSELKYRFEPIIIVEREFWWTKEHSSLELLIGLFLRSKRTTAPTAAVKMKVQQIVSVLPLLFSGTVALSSDVREILDMLANSAEASTGLKRSFQNLFLKSTELLFSEFEQFKKSDDKIGATSEYPYFGIIPPYQGSLVPGADALSWVCIFDFFLWHQYFAIAFALMLFQIFPFSQVHVLKAPLLLLHLMVLFPSKLKVPSNVTALKVICTFLVPCPTWWWPKLRKTRAWRCCGNSRPTSPNLRFTNFLKVLFFRYTHT